MEQTAIDVREQHGKLLETYDELEGLITQMGDQLLVAAPEVSGWSVGEHIEHLSITTSMSCKLIVRMTEGKAGESDLTPNAERLAILMRGADAGSLRLGIQAGPRMSPQPGLDREKIQTNLNRTRIKIGQVEAVLDQVPAVTTRFKHMFFGPLLCSEWVFFIHQHARHHLNIAKAVRAALGK